MNWARSVLTGRLSKLLGLEQPSNDLFRIMHELKMSNRDCSDRTNEIQELETKVEQLQVCVGALVNAIHSKGMLSADERENLAILLEAVGKFSRLTPSRSRPSDMPLATKIPSPPKSHP